MSADEMLSEDGPSGTQEANLDMHTVTMPDGGKVIWDPVSKRYKPVTDERKPDMHQVPGTPPSGVDFQEKTKNPQFEGVFAKTAAVRLIQLAKEPEDDWGVYSDHSRGPYGTPLVYRGTFDECRAWIKDEGRYASHIAQWSPEPANETERFTIAAQEFWDLAEATTNPSQKRQYYQKADYYKRMAEMYRRDPAAEQADHAGPAATSQSDVYNDAVPKRNPGMTDDSFPAMISHHIPKVISMPTDRFNNHDRITLGSDDANLRDCPNECGGLMGDYDGESVCHDCGHKEKIHYAQAKDAGFLAPLALGAGELAGGAVEGLGVTNALRAGSLMSRVMGGGGESGGGAVGAETPDAGAGSAEANDNMRSAGYGDVPGPWDGYPSWQYSGDPHVDLGVAEEKLMAGECTQAEFNALLDRAQRTNVDDPYDVDPDEARNNEELGWYEGDDGEMTNDFGRSASSVSDEDGLYGNNQSGHDSEPDSGNKGSEGQDRSADELDGDSGEGGAKAMTGEQLFLSFEKYLESIADNPDSHTDPIAIAVHEALLKDDPEYLTKAARYEISKTSSGQCPTCHIDLTNGATECGGPANVPCPLGFDHPGQAPMGQPGGMAQNPGGMGQPMSSVVHEAKLPKMCPAHEHLVNYALTLQDPAAALGAFSGQLFGEHSCQGGWAAENANGNPIKCKYKPEMIKQEYWDEKEAAAEQRRLEREQAAEMAPVVAPEQDPQFEQVAPEPEGQLVGGPALDEQLEEARGPVTQEIPSVDGAPTDEDYIAPEQGAQVIQFPQSIAPANFATPEQHQQIAASYKWSGPGMLTPELAPSEGPEQMLSDTPPEEVPSESAVSTEAPLDSMGNPIEVGQSYEVRNPNNPNDAVPDIYTISAVDPNFLQFEVGGDDAPIKFTDTLATAQIQAEGLTFTPASGDANASGNVEPSGNSDATGESDAPGSVTDLDTGGNSHASAFVDRLEKMAWEAPPQGDEINTLYEQIAALRAQVNELESAALEHQMGQREQAAPAYNDSDYDDGGEGDEPFDRDPTRTGSVMEGNPDLDWLNDGGMDKTAGRDYSIGEQRGFVNESGDARNLDKLDLSGTHYPVAGSDDPYSDFMWG